MEAKSLTCENVKSFYFKLKVYRQKAVYEQLKHFAKRLWLNFKLS